MTEEPALSMPKGTFVADSFGDYCLMKEYEASTTSSLAID